MFTYINLVFLLILFTINIFHFNSFDKQKRESEIESFITVTNLPGVLQSVGFYEDRFAQYEDGSNIYYMNLPKISYMKFTYE